MTPRGPEPRPRRAARLPPAGATALLLAAFAFAPAHAQHESAWVPGRGHGSISVAYQDLYIHYHTDSHGNRQVPGTIDDRSVFLDLDYGLTDKLALSVVLPFKSNRYRGNPHPPLEHHHEDALIEDGRYHGGWGDWELGLRYQWRETPWAITPYLRYQAPSHDYLTYAHNALGTGQQRLEAGVELGHRLSGRLHNLYVEAGIGYAFMEVVDHRRVDHATASVGAGWFATPRLTARLLLVAQKTFNGLDFPEDYAGSDEDTFAAHDQNLRNDFVNLGAGLDYRIGERDLVFANYGHTLWGENAHLIDHAITVGFSHGF